MSRLILLLLSGLVLVTGCAVKVVPSPQAGAGIIDAKENTMTIAKDTLVMTAGCREPEMINHQAEGMVASFRIEIQNLGSEEVSFDYDGFALVDTDSRQYTALSPEKVKEMLAKDSYYLLPYPYVGFYYLEDYERASVINSSATRLPYYYEYRPQELYANAFPAGPILPKAKVSGDIYFRVDLGSLSGFRLLVFQKGRSRSSAPDFIFPFTVSK
jgi:hypothetical protein